MQKGQSRKISGDMITSEAYGQIFPQVCPRRKEIARQQQKNTSSFFLENQHEKDRKE